MNHWNGKLWYAYGTSMTSIKQGKYVPVVEKLSGLRVVNLGIPGGCLTPDGYGKGNGKRAVMTLEDGKQDADLITLEVLPNEGKIVGDIYDTDDVSFCGCLNQCLRYLQENKSMYGTACAVPFLCRIFVSATNFAIWLRTNELCAMIKQGGA